ncbi:hypothetical protein BGZ57DRAFT_918928, partial [Hyaloscypha finlandica]
MIFDSPLLPPYSIPSLVVSVVAIIVIEVLVYTLLSLRFYTFNFIPSIYDSLLLFSTYNLPLYLPTYDAPGLPFKTSNTYIIAIIVEVLVQISRTILGTLDKCF